MVEFFELEPIDFYQVLDLLTFQGDLFQLATEKIRIKYNLVMPLEFYCIILMVVERHQRGHLVLFIFLLE